MIKRRLFLSPLPYRVIRVGMGIISIYAGIAKLLDIKAFALAIDQ